MISLIKNENTILLNFEIYLINKSNNSSVNLFILATTIKLQIESVYNKKYSNINLQCNVTITPLYKYELKKITTRIVFAVSNHITNNNVAEAYFCSNLVKINVNQLDAIISNKNTRSIPHEVGNLLGFNHPHARAKFNSVNEYATDFERNMTDAERQINLMSQTWYVQQAGKNENEALNLTQSQLELLIENFEKKRLNKNHSIKRSLFGWHWLVNFNN